MTFFKVAKGIVYYIPFTVDIHLKALAISVSYLVTNYSVKYYAIPSINGCVTEKHMVEDDILFTKPLAGKGLSVNLNHLKTLLII